MSEETKAAQVYVVQRMDSVQAVVGWTGDETTPSQEPIIEKRDYWVDIATIEVEPRTKRSTVIKRALAKEDIALGVAPPKLRALDAESAQVHEPEAYQPPMEWRL